MAFGLPNPFDDLSTQAQVEAVEELYGTVPVYATFSALPDPASLIDGTVAMVLEIAEHGLPGYVMIRSGIWVTPIAALQPTVSFVIAEGAGVGELPEALVVGAGATVALGQTSGTPWVLDATRSFSRPSGVVVTPIDPSSLEIGPRGAGIWRFAVQVNYDATVPSSGLETSFVVQRDQGVGFADVPHAEIARLLQSSPASVDGLTQVGFHLNLPVAVGEKFRIGVRHNDSVARTYTFNSVIFVANQLSADLT